MLAFGSAIFLSAFLVFIIQPILAKKLLPWFGGSPSVWLCIVFFFQSTLLIGYFYAFLLTKIKRPTLQASIHLSLLTLSLIFIPLTPFSTLSSLPFWPPIVVFIVLTTTLLPILMLSASSPLLQYWYCHIYQTEFPHRFYALSNTGSLVALLLFPFLLEPLLGLNQQLQLWSLSYIMYFASAGICLILVVSKKTAVLEPIQPKISTLNRSHLISWLILTFLSCTLLLSSTQMMMQNIVSFPLLWLCPLTLYLLSFILTFSYPRSYYRSLWIPLYGLLSAMILFIFSHHQLLLLIQLILFSTLLFSGCMICHGELIRLKPHKMHLTLYYLFIALGGVLGGLFVNLLSPLLFNHWWDFYLALLGIFGYALFLVLRQKSLLHTPFFSLNVLKYSGCLAFIGLAVLLFRNIQHDYEDVIFSHRNFFGKINIVDRNPNSEFHQRLLYNGNIVHGHQYLTPTKELVATSYFSQYSGAGLAIEFMRMQKTLPLTPGLNIGVIGLGTGTIAALTQQADCLKFYEIDPDVVHIAKNYFLYLHNCPAQTEIEIGDGRLCLFQALQNKGPEHYDVLIIDAFNGDAIPLHLLTLEAMQIYLSHLAPNGILAFHVSSRYVDLYPPLQALAKSFGIYSYLTRNAPDSENWIFLSEWVLMSPQNDIGYFLFQKNAIAFNSKRMEKPWTDDQNTLLSVVKW